MCIFIIIFFSIICDSVYSSSIFVFPPYRLWAAPCFCRGFKLLYVWPLVPAFQFPIFLPTLPITLSSYLFGRCNNLTCISHLSPLFLLRFQRLLLLFVPFPICTLLYSYLLSLYSIHLYKYSWHNLYIFHYAFWFTTFLWIFLLYTLPSIFSHQLFFVSISLHVYLFYFSFLCQSFHLVFPLFCFQSRLSPSVRPLHFFPYHTLYHACSFSFSSMGFVWLFPLVV